MACKLRTKKGRAVYARRKVIPEPVFGQMKALQGAGQLLLRGHDTAAAEWNSTRSPTTSASSPADKLSERFREHSDIRSRPHPSRC